MRQVYLCFDRESNTGPRDLQSCALPTELSKLRAVIADVTAKSSHTKPPNCQDSRYCTCTQVSLYNIIYIHTLVTQEKQCGHPIDKNHCTTRCTTMAIYKLLKTDKSSISISLLKNNLHIILCINAYYASKIKILCY